MAQPVLVRAYTDSKRRTPGAPGARGDASAAAAALPPVSSYAFADILRAVNGSRDFQIAIDGIAEICAKTKLSLADEYAAHLPPLGEITTASASASTTPRAPPRPGMRRVLTSVPEASSGSSEGSRKSSGRKRASIFGFRTPSQTQNQTQNQTQTQTQTQQDSRAMRHIRISSLGRTIAVGTTTAMAVDVVLPERGSRSRSRSRSSSEATVVGRPRTASLAQSSLQRLLAPGRVRLTS